MHSLTSPSGTVISYEKYGKGPPLVLVHGSFSNHQTNCVQPGTDLFIPEVNGGYAYVLSRSVWVPMIILWAAVSASVLCLGGRHLVLEL